MIRPAVALPNSTSAIGRPDARLFFEPQNNSTAASARFSRAVRAVPTVIPSMTANSAPPTTATATTRHGLTELKMCSAMLIENAV